MKLAKVAVDNVPAFDFLENFEIPARNPGFLEFLQGLLENPGIPGRIPGVLDFLVGILVS